MSDIEYRVDDRVATILLNRPERKNAFTKAMVDAWAEMLREAAHDDRVGAVVVTGAGDAFCAGGDFTALEPSGSTAYDRKQFLFAHVHRVAREVEDLDKLLVAAVNGPAVGAGMDMALLCDIRFAARRARFAEAYINVGLVPGDGGAFLLPRLVGTAKALELLLTGDPIDAAEAHRLGIVNRVYDDERLLAETYTFAERIANGPTLIARTIKRAVYQSLRLDLRTHLDLISSHMGVVQSTKDSAEAFAAFREKREPHFEGR